VKKLRAPLTVLMLLASATAVSDNFHDQPDPQATGGITGKVKGGEPAAAIAVEQVTQKFYQGSAGADGTYTFIGLPPGKYDLLLKLKEDVIDGIRLDDWGETEELPKEDIKAIEKLIQVTDDYYHDKNIVRRGGTKKLQKLVVEQIRTRKTYNPDGTVAEGKMFRRIDYTILKKTREVWQIQYNRHMFREERPKDGPGSTVRFHYEPKLGGIRVADRPVTVEDVELEKKDAEKK